MRRVALLRRCRRNRTIIFLLLALFFTLYLLSNYSGNFTQLLGAEVHERRNDSWVDPTSPKQLTALQFITATGLPPMPSPKAYSNASMSYQKKMQSNNIIVNSELLTAGVSTVVLVQTHSRANYFAHLLASLKKATGWNSTLLVISHDFYDDDMNDLVHGIHFAAYVDIYYPFPLQIYQGVFPDESPTDCNRDLSQAQALLSNCANREFPDKYKHYREARFSQMKLHWLWKLRHIFTSLPHLTSVHLPTVAAAALNDFTGVVLFLEEDHYVAPDFLFLLAKMRAFDTSGKNKVFALGNHHLKQKDQPDYVSRGSKLFSNNFISSRHNMAFGFDHKVFAEVQACVAPICGYDDYNWDWSLQNAAVNCIPGNLPVLYTLATRVFHIGDCGTHFKGSQCDSASKVAEIEKKLAANKAFLFPVEISIGNDVTHRQGKSKPSGGWGDPRDHQLCSCLLTQKDCSGLLHFLQTQPVGNRVQ